MAGPHTHTHTHTCTHTHTHTCTHTHTHTRSTATLPLFVCFPKISDCSTSDWVTHWWKNNLWPDWCCSGLYLIIMDENTRAFLLCNIIWLLLFSLNGYICPKSMQISPLATRVIRLIKQEFHFTDQMCSWCTWRLQHGNLMEARCDSLVADCGRFLSCVNDLMSG